MNRTKSPTLYAKLKRFLMGHPVQPSPKSNLETTDFFSSTSESFQGSYSTDPDFQERRALWAAMVSKYAPGLKSALDLGCGPGVLTQELLGANLSVTAVDGSEEMLKLCRKNSALQRNGEAEFLHDYLPSLEKLHRREFDLLLCSSVLEYVDELQPAMDRISQLLAPGGKAILSMPNRESIYRKYEAAKFTITGRPEYRAHIKHMLTKDELADVAGRAGLALRECHYYGNGSALLTRVSGILPVARRKNLFLCVFEKKANLAARQGKGV